MIWAAPARASRISSMARLRSFLAPCTAAVLAAAAGLTWSLSHPRRVTATAAARSASASLVRASTLAPADAPAAAPAANPRPTGNPLADTRTATPTVGSERPILKPQLAWKLLDDQGRAAVLSSPALAEGRLFIGAENATLYCLDAAAGTLLWRAGFDWEVSSPVAASGRVFVGEGLHGTTGVRFRCLAADTGATIWQQEVPGHIEGGAALAGGQVFFAGGPAGVFCLSAADGSEVWNSRSRHVDGTPELAGGRLSVATTLPSLLCLDARSGRILWEVRVPHRIWGRPQARNGRVYLLTSNGDLETVAASPAATVMCLEATSGRLVWKKSFAQSCLGGVAVAGNTLVCGARDGKVYGLDPSTGAERWCWKGQGGVYCPPASEVGLAYFAGSDGQIRCLDTGDGQLVWSWDFGALAPKHPAFIVGAPALSDGRLYLAGTNGIIACLAGE